MIAPVDEGRLFGRGIAFPPRISPEGRVAVSSGSENIREAIKIVLSTEMQERVMLPEFGGGLRSFLFQPNIVSTHRLIEQRIVRALARWEPRISVTSVSVTADTEDPDTAIATVKYRLVATSEPESVSVAVQLAT